MAEEFVGLTVKFGANTVEFDNSVKGMNTALTQLKKELQTINQQLKLDPNNVELLNRKMQNFQQQAEIGAKKIAELRKEQAALGDEKIGTAEWQKLENEIQKTEAQMQVVQRAIDSTQSKLNSITPGKIEYVNRQLDEMSQKLDNAAEKVGKVKEGFEKAGNAVAPFSAAAAGGLAASVKIAADLDEQISKTSQVFKTQAKEVDSFTRSAIDNFGMSELSARNIANVYGSIGTGVGIADKENANMATTLTELTSDMAAFNDVSLDRAATALKGVYTGETESIKDMGISLSQTSLDAYALEKGLGKSTSQMSEAEKISLRYQYVLDRMGKQGSIGAATREMDSFNGQSRKFVENMIEIGKKIGDVVKEAITPFLLKLNELAEGFRKMGDGRIQSVAKALVAVAVLAPALLGIAKVLGVVQGVLGGLSKAMLFLKDTKIAGAFAKIFGGVSTGPILLVVGAIVAVGVALKQLWDRSETFRNTMADIWESIKTNITNAIKTITGGNGLEGIKVAWEKVWSYLEPAWTLFQEIVGAGAVTIGAAIETITKVFTGLADIIAGAFSGNHLQVQTGFQAIYDAFVGFKDRVFEYIGSIDWGELAKTAITGIINGITALGSFLWDAFKLLFNTTIEWIKSVDWAAVGSWVLQTLINGIVALRSFLWTTVQSLFKTAMNFIKSIDWAGVGSTIMNLIITAISALGSMVWNTLKGLFTTAKNNSTNSIDWGSVGNKIINMIGEAITTVGGAIWYMLRGALDTAMSKAKNVDWGSVGKSIVDSIVSGITGLGDAIHNKISSAFESAKSWVSEKWNALKGSGDFSFSGKMTNSKGQSIQLASPTMPMLMASGASSGTNLSITVNTQGNGAKAIAREVEKIIVRRIQS